MEIHVKDYEIGVIVGRFQTNKLHQAHIDLIETVIKKHKKIVLFLGVSPAISTRKNPLDFATRKAMIEETFGTKISAILPLYDEGSDIAWSNQLDKKVREVFQVGSVVLYGSRDSFIPYYKGKFNILELEPEVFVSATDSRKEVSREIISSENFRAGIIYSVYNSFPVVHPTVDIAILDDKQENVLLGRKPNQDKYRFVGGFTDTTDESFEFSAKRECLEETGLEVGNMEYIGSFKVNDWRYRNESTRSIMTTFFKCKKIFGSPTPQDDIIELKWFKITDIKDCDIVPEHINLFNNLKTNLKIINNDEE